MAFLDSQGGQTGFSLPKPHMICLSTSILFILIWDTVGIGKLWHVCFMNKSLLEHSHSHCFHMFYCSVHTTTDLCSCDRGHTVHKNWNMWYLPIYRKSLLINKINYWFLMYTMCYWKSEKVTSSKEVYICVCSLKRKIAINHDKLHHSQLFKTFLSTLLPHNFSTLHLDSGWGIWLVLVA